jgi:chemotaxis protein CheY-P-specific phosphatase CheC/tetratricopeptide (TPR) repeat protein
MDTAIKRELKTLLKRGEDALLRRDYERASTYFRRAYTADPGNINAITNLGYTYAKMGRFTHAQKCFITALDIDPDNQVARRNLSLLMKPDKDRGSSPSVPGKGKPAEELFQRYMEWGNLQMGQRNFYAAIQYYKEASRIHPDFIEPYLKIGIGFEELKEYASAVGAFTDALDIFPKDPIAQEHLKRCRGIAEDRYEPPGAGSSVLLEQVYAAGDISPSDERIPLPDTYTQESSQTTQFHASVPRVPEKDEKLITRDAKPVLPSPEPGQHQQTEDDVIRSILNQYSDIIHTNKSEEVKTSNDQAIYPEEGQVKAPESPVKEQDHSSPPPPVSSDDIVSSILMQYQEDIDEHKSDDIKGQSEQESDQIPYTGQTPLSGGEETMNMPKKDGIHVELNDDQKDALRELGNIGASHAATTLSTMLNTPIMLNVPEISIMNFEEISQQISEESSAMVIFTMEGQMAKAGYVILHVPRESVVQMTSIMLGMPIEPTRELNEMDESAINEIGNIMVSAFLDGTAELLGIIMLPSPPRTLFDFPKNVFNLIIQESNILYDNVVFFRTELICDEHELNLNIFMLPNPPVLQEIVRMLEQIIEDSAQGR